MNEPWLAYCVPQSVKGALLGWRLVHRAKFPARG